MNIVTKQGDNGTTTLMYSRRVPKTHPRIEAVGTVDELNAAIGLARAMATPGSVTQTLHKIQTDLVALMGELATDTADNERYRNDGFPTIGAENVQQLEDLAGQLESKLGKVTGWCIPGPPPLAAAIDLARTICRRCERVACCLHERGQVQNAYILVYLNRLSDVLWLIARAVERAIID